MNICIGGPWNGCKLLGDSHDKSFKVKDNKLQRIVKYNRKIIHIKKNVYIFWIVDELSESEASTLMNDYLREYFIKAEIELIGDEL